MRRGAAILALAVLVSPAAAQQPAAPEGRCNLVLTGNTDSTHVTSVRLASGKYNNYLGGGVTGRCPEQQLTLVADSAEYFGDLQRWHLIGNVHYTEPRLTSDSKVATYYIVQDRLLAEGDVHATLPSGTTLVGPRVEYLRARARVRPAARMTATGRPTITVVPHDSSGKTSEPMKVIANRVVMVGDSLVYASGRVDITRTDVLAKGDSAALDSQTQFARLMRKPSISSRGSRHFTLYGTVIDLFGENRSVRRVLSKGAAKSVSEDATLTADTLDFRLDSGLLQRVYAWGRSRSRAVNPRYDIVADSMDVRMPAQRMREIHAVRQAFAKSLPDTVRLRTRERDWMRGDTIVARFDSARAVPADSAGQPELRALIALGHASSFYHLAAKDTSAVSPAINYVKGKAITVAFDAREVQRVTILDQAEGLYLEPGIEKEDSAKTTRKAPAARSSSP